MLAYNLPFLRVHQSPLTEEGPESRLAQTQVLLSTVSERICPMPTNYAKDALKSQNIHLPNFCNMRMAYCNVSRRVDT